MTTNKDTERAALKFALDELFVALDNWMALQRQVEQTIRHEPSPFLTPMPYDKMFTYADDCCERALCTVLSLAGWTPRILSNMDHLRTLVHMADSTTTMDTEVTEE